MYAVASNCQRSNFATQPMQSNVERENLPANAQFKVLTSAFMVGTLGLATPTFVEKRSATSTWNIIPVSSASGDRTTYARDWIRSSADNLKHIRSVLRVGITDLAAVLGVARQALYNWLAGDSISAGNAARLEDLAGAADVLVAAGLAETPQLLKRKLPGGKTFLEIVRDGGEAKNAAHELVKILEHEIAQRKMLEMRLAKRKPVAIDDSDIGLPMLDEGV